MTSAATKLKQFFRRMAHVESDVIFYGFLGNAAGTIKADNNGNVYVILFNGQVVIARNSVAPMIPRLPVALGYSRQDQKLLRVLKVWNVYDEIGSPEVQPHGETHTWPNPDFIPVRQEQILPGLMLAIGSMNVQLYGFYYFLDGQYHLVNHQTFDLTSYVPGTEALWVSVEIDAAGVITYNSGTSVASRDLLVPELIPVTPSDRKLLFSVKCYEGQTLILQTSEESDLFDPRFAGVASGGVASTVSWVDIEGKPSTFIPDTSVTDLLYPTITYALVPPAASDDDVAGFKRGDLWIDGAGLLAYTAVDVTTGAAVWVSGGGASSGGGGDLNFRIEGALSATTDVFTFLITKNMTVDFWYIYCDAPGSAGSTIYDVLLNGTTLFSTSGDRPTLVWNDPAGWAKSGIPDVVDFVEGDIITINIDSVATGAASLTGVGQVTSSSGGGSTSTSSAASKVFMNRNFT